MRTGRRRESMYKVGLLGCGGYGDPRPTAPYSSLTRQAQAWQLQPDVSFVAIADPDERHLNRHGEDLGVPMEKRYHSYEEMLEKEPLDVLIIAAEPDRHAELVLPVLERGIHAVIDKPMSVDLKTADAMVETARRKDVRLAVLHQGRVSPRDREAQRRIAAGDIGRIVEMRGAGKGYYGGYDLLNAAPHILNSMRGFVNSEFDWVQGVLESGNRLTQPRDIVQGPSGFGLIAAQHARFQVGFKDGTMASICHLHHDPARPDNVYLVVRGTEGQLCVTYDALYVTCDTHWGPGVEWERIQIPPERTSIEGVSANEPQGDLWFAHEMVTALNEGREHTCSGKEAVAGLEAIMGCLTSHFGNGERIALPLKERSHPLLRVREEAGLGPAPETPTAYDAWLEAEIQRMEVAGLNPYAISRGVTGLSPTYIYEERKKREERDV